jgi:NDP-sugar pyrophosphorylase family protein|tara:strand:- start:371 stop:1114 length:744 start_codon:yes stop_codon:yes gene_type:complete
VVYKAQYGKMKKIDSIILAGGLGTRLRKVVPDLPKPMVSINGKPFLDLILSLLNKCGSIERVILAVGYMADKIIEKFEKSSEYNFKVLFSVEETLLGTGGAIKKALKYTKTENVLVLNGDSYVDIDLYDFLKKHLQTKADMTIVLKELENTNRYGSVKIDENNKITCFEEKKPGVSKGYINAGIYLIKRSLFDNLKENTVISLEKELLPVFIKKDVFGYIGKGKFIDIGIPENYRIAGKYLYKEGVK